MIAPTSKPLLRLTATPHSNGAPTGAKTLPFQHAPHNRTSPEGAVSGAAWSTPACYHGTYQWRIHPGLADSYSLTQPSPLVRKDWKCVAESMSAPAGVTLPPSGSESNVIGYLQVTVTNPTSSTKWEYPTLNVDFYAGSVKVTNETVGATTPTPLVPESTQNITVYALDSSPTATFDTCQVGLLTFLGDSTYTYYRPWS